MKSLRTGALSLLRRTKSQQKKREESQVEKEWVFLFIRGCSKKGGCHAVNTLAKGLLCKLGKDPVKKKPSGEERHSIQNGKKGRVTSSKKHKKPSGKKERGLR